SDVRDDNRLAILADHFYRTRYGSDPKVLGNTIDLGRGAPYTIVGVLPRAFRLPLWTPRAAQVESDVITLEARRSTVSGLIARLKSGVTLATARRELLILLPPGAKGELPITPLHDRITGSTRRALIVLSIAVVCVLLV